MAMIGAAIGLGNIWRFSYVLYSQGGGAFFIPYITAIVIMGIPFLIMEYALGYKFKDSLSNILKKVKPYFEFIGWFVAFLVFLVLTYYVVIIGWDCLYLILSFFKGWGADPNMYFNNNIIMGGSENFSGIFTPVIPVSIITIVLWIIIWFISHKSLDNLSKVVKVLIPTLFIIMAFIIIYAVTLPGHTIGLYALFKPNWSLLLDIDIWLAAFGQILFSLSMGQAIALTYASYLSDDVKLVDNVLYVVVSNSLFEIFTAVGVFSILGFMCLQSGLPIEDVATSGTGLLFIVFPQIFNIMGDVAYIIAPLFFLCVLFAGITSALAFLEVITNGVSMKFGYSRVKSVTLFSIIGVAISLILTTGAGNYLITILDTYLNQFGILLGVILQAVVIGWLYGVEKLTSIINENSTIKVGRLWILTIKMIMPVILSIMWIFGIFDLIASEDHLTLTIEAIITIAFIVVPCILTILPSKNSENIEKN
ncbi:MAG: sodium-dependent transporter [Methanosphaera sp.]|nr:sodium-dependent transporter [Methanosphaera sp.]